MPRGRHPPVRARGTGRGQARGGRSGSRATPRATRGPPVTTGTDSPDSLNPAMLSQMLQVIRAEVAASLQAHQPTPSQPTAVSGPATSQPTIPSQIPPAGTPHAVPAATLGTLPPPGQLASVPLATSGPTFSTSPPTVSQANITALPSLISTLPPVISPTQTAVTQYGTILSPASEPIPQKLVDKARSGQFVDTKELLSDNMALISQLEAVQGLPPITMLGAGRPRLREVTSLSTWCHCFLGYMAIHTTDPATRDQLMYARLIIREARRHGGLGWLDYDRAFRQQAAADPSLRWNTLIPGLQASTIIGHRAGQGSFCNLCRGADHSQGQCALSCLHPPTSSAPPTSRVPRASTQRGRSGNICISWNKGACIFPGECEYKHICATCHPAVSAAHRAKDCTKTPENSVYKRTSRPPATTA